MLAAQQPSFANVGNAFWTAYKIIIIVSSCWGSRV